MAISQLDTTMSRCPNCTTTMIARYDYLACPDCGHVPYQGAD